MGISKLWRFVALVLVVALVLAFVPGCTTTEDEETGSTEIQTLKEGELQVGSDTSFPPFETLEGDKVTGFDVDLMNAIGEELDLEVTFITTNFDGIIPSLNAKKFDCIASAMTITDERKKEVTFSDPYIDSNQSLTVKKSSGIKSTKDLAGKVVGAQTGTTGEMWMQENIKNAKELKSFPTATEAFTALEAGQIDGIINDLPVSAYIVKDKAELAVVEEIKTDEQYGFAFRKSDTALVKGVNDALKKLKDNGEYDKIYKKWFGEQ